MLITTVHADHLLYCQTLIKAMHSAGFNVQLQHDPDESKFGDVIVKDGDTCVIECEKFQAESKRRDQPAVTAKILTALKEKC